MNLEIHGGAMLTLIQKVSIIGKIRRTIGAIFMSVFLAFCIYLYIL